MSGTTSWAAALPSRHTSAANPLNDVSLSMSRTACDYQDQESWSRSSRNRHSEGDRSEEEPNHQHNQPGSKSQSNDERKVSLMSSVSFMETPSPKSPRVSSSLKPPEVKTSPVVGLDRSQWKKMVLQRNPEIQELRERVFPIHRAAMFVELHQPTVAAEDEAVMREGFLQLVMQAFHYYGFNESLHTLERESGTQYADPYPPIDECKLRHYLHKSIKQTERVYDLVLGETMMDSDMDLLEEHLTSLGLIEDSEDERQDVDIWEEPEEGNVLREPSADGWETSIRAGTLNKLVEKLTAEQTPDLIYVKTFLMTYQSFTTPPKLLEKLFQRYEVPPMKGADSEKVRACIQLRVVNALKKWLEEYYSDFDTDMLNQLNEWLKQKAAHGTPAAMAHTKSLMKSLRKAQTPATTKTERTAGGPEPIIIKNIFSTRLTINDVDDQELARQITLVEFELFRQIKPYELLNQSWSKPKLRHRAQNVLALIGRFNKVSLWVAHHILKKPTVKLRVKIMMKFLNIVQHLRAFNNFNTIMSILAGLNIAAVHRLKHTRDALPERGQQIIHELSKLTSTDGSYKTMREVVANCDPPCFPYLGIYLTDLTFIDENPNNIEGLINFNKRKLIYNVISKIQQYQQLPYNFQPVHQIQKLLLNLPNVDEQELYRMSLILEPRGAERSQVA